MVSGGFDATLCVWDLAADQLRHQLDLGSEGMRDGVFLPNSNILLTACFDGAARVTMWRRAYC
ncbi:MAG: WD40 repeat domain-containing protein [Caldilineaceae bacterium]